MAKYVIEDTTLNNTANAIREKTGKTDKITPSNFATEIASIESGSAKYNPRYITFREIKATDLTEEISNLDTSNVTDMSYMFYNCNKLTSLDVSNFNTSNVTNMQQMFYNCNQLTSLDVSNFNTSNVTNMSYMFQDCGRITSLDVSSFDTNKVTNMMRMFNGCNGITSLDVSNFNTSDTTDTSYMFNGSPNLTKLIINNPNVFKMTSTNMFTNTPIANGSGYVYVPDNLVDTYKSATNWSTYADQIKPISELEANV